jgi:two-component system phosphate regulon response regulator PhoB
MDATVLLVDDEPDVVDLVRHKLRRAGFEVLVAMTGWNGLQLAKSERPDVLILDLMLPEMNGFEVCQQLKADPETVNIPVLMLTAKCEDDDRFRGFELGADDYVTKPFSPRELVYRITALLRRSKGPAQPDSLEFDGFKVDRSGMRVFLDGNKLELTTTEYKLLTLLLERRGRVQQRDTLLTEVWEYQRAVDTRTVDTHMRRLREKLGEHASRIETIRGKGYRFCAGNSDDEPLVLVEDEK